VEEVTPPKKKIKVAETKPKKEKEEKEEISYPETVEIEEKPLFVKIDKYKDVMRTIKELKIKLDEANAILSEIAKIKEEEEKELQKWTAELGKIKDKLISIDKSLFEV